MNQLSLKDKELLVEKADASAVWWCRNALGVKTLTWSEHIEVLEAMRTNDRVAIASGHSLGKDFLSGQISLDFLYNNPQSVVITTAPTDRQVEKIIWGEITKYWKPELGGRLLTQEIKIAPDWYAIGFTTKDSRDLIGKFQGFKGRSILVVVTEAHAVEDSIYEQIEGILTSDNSKLYLAGNSLRSEGYFYDAFKPRSGFKTFNWSCYDSPNYIAGKEVIPGMVGRKWVEDKERRWGKTSPRFMARVRGIFPGVAIDTLISPNVMEPCVKEPTRKKGFVGVGVDVARYGDDLSVIKVCQDTEEIYSESFSHKPTTETAGRTIAICKKFNANGCAIDDAGVGGGVTDMLYEAVTMDPVFKKTEIEGLLVGRPAWNKEVYANLRAELFWGLREGMIRKQLSILPCEDTQAELTHIKYRHNRRGQILIESKEDMRKRGVPSPNHADSLMLAFYASRLKYSIPIEKPVAQEGTLEYHREIIARHNGVKRKRKVKQYANFR